MAKNTKKSLFFLLCLGFLLVLAGCGHSIDGNNEDKTEYSSQTEVTGSDSTEIYSEGDESQETESIENTENTVDTEGKLPSADELHAYDFILCFGGDLSLAETAVTTGRLDQSPNGIRDCISEDLITLMQGADLMCINNEFAYSTNGAPLKGKKYTFRANPTRVEILKELGVDVAQLCNNHVYDYGKQALLDTFTTLEEAGIPYFGAGRTLKEAMAPVYFTLDGKVVALVGASRAEKYKMTPQATETEPGILRCYNNELFLKAIREADANADFVIAVVHWGTEYSTKLEEVQLSTRKEYLDAGADAIIGGHSHCLQGMEYYDGKPIIYSLGNFWFNSKTLDTMLVQLHFSGDDNEQHLSVTVIPAIQKSARTQMVNGAEAERIFTHLEKISINIEIDETGLVKEKNAS